MVASTIHDVLGPVPVEIIIQFDDVESACAPIPQTNAGGSSNPNPPDLGLHDNHLAVAPKTTVPPTVFEENIATKVHV